jgi:hypothetical protein
VKRYFPIILSILIVLVSFGVVYNIKNSKTPTKKIAKPNNNIGSFQKSRSCVRFPYFLSKMRIPQPIAIDLSQQHYKGLAFLFGRGFNRAVHIKAWERFDYFGGYALDRSGNMYLAPMPFISVKPYTFNLQKNIYKLDSKNGKLSIWLTLDEVKATSNNPFGIISIVYDCDDNSLWVSSIDKSDYFHSRGTIYHIDIASKKILQKVEGIDALSLQLLKSEKGKYLLAGVANDNTLIALEIKNSKLLSTPIKLFELPNEEEHIRKIRVVGKNHLRIQTIPFSYNLIAQTLEQASIRKSYDLVWDGNKWSLHK